MIERQLARSTTFLGAARESRNPFLTHLFQPMDGNLLSSMSRLKARLRPAFRDERTLFAMSPNPLASFVLSVYRKLGPWRVPYDPYDVLEFTASFGAEKEQYVTLSADSYARLLYRLSSGSHRCFGDPDFNQFLRFFSSKMKLARNYLESHPDLFLGTIPLAAEFLVDYYIAMRDRAAIKFKLGSHNAEVRRYAALSGLQPEGPMLVLGCGETALPLSNTLFFRPLILVDSDPLIYHMALTYAEKIARTNIAVLSEDVRGLSLEPESVGFILVESVLHILGEQEIAGTIAILSSLLSDSGRIHIEEPEKACCKFDDPKKIDVIRASLESRFSKVNCSTSGSSKGKSQLVAFDASGKL